MNLLSNHIPHLPNTNKIWNSFTETQPKNNVNYNFHISKIETWKTMQQQKRPNLINSIKKRKKEKLEITCKVASNCIEGNPKWSVHKWQIHLYVTCIILNFQILEKI